MTKQTRPVPTKVALVLEDRAAYVRVYAANTARGYYNVETVPLRTGACIPGMRKKARAHAKALKVPYVELDAQTKQVRY